ncbi:DUF6701 domain-containing protein [Vibrio rotiferianus]|uniref:DUF6701 domain-containing protein n=1 Tax=Vibrio rotiferianus TaxID=190895 RepID=UPI00406A5C61
MKKIISILVINSFLLFSSMVHASPSDEPKFEFGTVNCSTQSNNLAECVIHFENTYDEPPLVFVMSSIDSSLTRFLDKNGNIVNPNSLIDYYKKVKSAETEYPSDLRVWSVGKESSVIKQVIAPHNKACTKLSYLDKNWKCKSKGSYQIPVTYVPAPMGNIDYLVIEPGEISFTGGAKISAGYVDADLTTSKATGEVDFHTQEVYYKSRFDYGSEPGVLVQIQTRNNNQLENNTSSRPQDNPLWLTAIGYEPNNKSFELIIDRSEVSPNTRNNRLKHKERVAYVAGLGEGYYKLRKFWLGQGITQNTLDSFDDNLIRPVSDGCTSEEAKNYFNTGVAFTKPPVFLASKKLRKGNNGGWLRRCSVDKDGVYLINEEDMNSDDERGHVLEEFSYFLFEKPPVDDVCDLFRSPAQTWARNSSQAAGNLNMNNHALISGAELVGDKRYVGFDYGHVNMAPHAKCDNRTCSGNPDLMVEKQTLESFREPNDPALDWIVVSGRESGSRIFSNDERIGTLNVGKDGVVTFKSGTYWIGKINVYNGGRIEIPKGQKVTIHTKNFAISNHKSFVGELDGGELMVMVHYSPNESKVNLATSSFFTGLLYSEVDVPLSNHAVVNGAITAPNITMHNYSKIFATDNHCFTPSDDYELTLTPTKQYALACGDEQPRFIIETKNGTKPESTGVTVGIEPNESGLSVQVASNVGTGRYPHFITSKSSSNLGKLKLSVTVTDNDKIELNKDYKLTVTLDNDSSKELTSTFRFVPYKFDVRPQFVIAGQESQIDTKVLACQNDNQTVVKSYKGVPVVEWDIVTPAAGRKEESLFTYAPTFPDGSKGVTSSPFKVMESGVYTVTLTDIKFTCDPNYSSDCPIAPKGDDSSHSLETVLTGSFTVQSRPWKIAACDIVAKNGGKLNPGTQGTDSGFIPSGDSFSVTYKPVVHRDSKGQASDLCDYPVTQNFFSDESAKAQFDTEFSIAYPSSTDSDIANLGDKQQLEFNKDNAKSGLTMEYAWNEVGSLDLKTSGKYFQKSLTDNHVTIGRFYPKYFQVTGSNWTYPDAQSFAYMGQPFDGVSYSVEALNSNEDSLKNYALFESANQAMFNIDELDALGGRFDAPSSEGSWGLSDKTKSLGTFTIGGNSLCGADSSNRSIGSACFIKDFTKINDAKGYADGPYNQGADVTKIGLVFAGNSQDPVSFLNVDKANDSRLIIQPKIRFGRVNLSDAGEKQGTDTVIHIPLRIECWDGERFTPNLDDSQTRILGVKSKQAHIWPVGDDAIQANVELSAGGEVISGRSRSIEATEEKSNRQQTKVWLDLESGGNSLPWLKYNWDKKENGEENPSSVVTFGIHRGNDRVIYRGEPGLTGQ